MRPYYSKHNYEKKFNKQLKKDTREDLFQTLDSEGYEMLQKNVVKRGVYKKKPTWNLVYNT